MSQAVNSNKDFSAKKLKGSEQQKKIEELTVLCLSLLLDAGGSIPSDDGDSDCQREERVSDSLRQRGKSESENI